MFGVYDYEGQAGDELTFRCGDALTILRRGDEYEREWWWGQLRDIQGYVPRNLLGVRWMDVWLVGVGVGGSGLWRNGG